MARSTLLATKERVAVERELDPLALGPYVATLADEMNVPVWLMAKLMGAHEQTVYRWYVTRTPTRPSNVVKVIKVLAVLCWMHENKRRPLRGTRVQQEKQLAAEITAFLTISRDSQKTKQAV